MTPVTNAIADSLTDQDRRSVLLIQPFEARCQIYAVAQYRIFHPLRGAQIPDHRIAEMNTKTHDERLQPLGDELKVEGLAGRLCHKCGAAGPLDMIELQVRRIPEYHDGVADELIHRAPFGHKGLGQGGKM